MRSMPRPLAVAICAVIMDLLIFLKKLVYLLYRPTLHYLKQFLSLSPEYRAAGDSVVEENDNRMEEKRMGDKPDDIKDQIRRAEEQIQEEERPAEEKKKKRRKGHLLLITVLVIFIASCFYNYYQMKFL